MIVPQSAALRSVITISGTVHAAMLIAQGEHVRVIADRLGHANPMVTMTTYAHLFDGVDVAAEERLDEAWPQSVTDPGRTQTVPLQIPMRP